MLVGTWRRDGGRLETAGGEGAWHGSTSCRLAGELYGGADAASLAAGFDRDGTAALEAFEGAFAAVAQRGATTALACDPQGVGSLYLNEAAGALTFASELHGLLDRLDRVPDIDAGALTRWLRSGTLAADGSLLAGVRRLAPGHVLVLEPDGTRTLRARRPAIGRPAPHVAPEVAVREGVARAVSRRSDGDAAVLLSGGLDSTVVAAAAARSPTPPRALYSMRFPGLVGQDETPWIELVTRALGIPSVRAVVRTGSIVGGMLDWSSRWRTPLPAANWWYQRLVLEHMAADGITAVLDGEGGDELFSAGRYLAADRLRAGRPLAAVGLVRRLPGAAEAHWRAVARAVGTFAVRGALPYALHRRLAGGDGFEDRWAWTRRRGPRWQAHLRWVLTDGIAEVGAHEHFRLRAAAAGLRVRHPLRDLDLADLVLSLPPELAFDAHRDRPLLRRAMEGIAPPEVLGRRGKARFESLLVRLLAGPDLPALGELLGDGALVRAYLPPEWPADLTTPPSTGLAAWADRVFRAAAAECWLRELAEPGACAQLAERLPLTAPDVVFEPGPDVVAA